MEFVEETETEYKYKTAASDFELIDALDDGWELVKVTNCEDPGEYLLRKKIHSDSL